MVCRQRRINQSCMQCNASGKKKEASSRDRTGAVERHWARDAARARPLGHRRFTRRDFALALPPPQGSFSSIGQFSIPPDLYPRYGYRQRLCAYSVFFQDCLSGFFPCLIHAGTSRRLSRSSPPGIIRQLVLCHFRIAEDVMSFCVDTLVSQYHSVLYHSVLSISF